MIPNLAQSDQCIRDVTATMKFICIWIAVLALWGGSMTLGSDPAFKMGRTLKFPTSIQGMSLFDLVKIRQEVNEKTWNDIRHLFVIKPTQTLLNILQIPLGDKADLVVLPPKGHREVVMVTFDNESSDNEDSVDNIPNISEAQADSPIAVPVVVPVEGPGMEVTTIPTTPTTTAPEPSVMRCDQLGRACKISVNPNLDLIGLSLCFHYRTGLLGKCVHPRKILPCNPEDVILCHPFPDLAEIFFKNVPIGGKLRLRTALSDLGANNTSVRRRFQSGDPWNNVFHAEFGSKLVDSSGAIVRPNESKRDKNHFAHLVNNDPENALGMITDLYLQLSLETIPGLILVVGHDLHELRQTLKVLNSIETFTPLGLFNPHYQHLDDPRLFQAVVQDGFHHLRSYTQFESFDKAAPNLVTDLDKMLFDFLILANEDIPFQTRAQVAQNLDLLDVYNVDPGVSTQWLSRLELPSQFDWGSSKAFVVDQRIQIHMFKVAISMKCRRCQDILDSTIPTIYPRDSRSLLTWFQNGIELKQQLLSTAKLVPLWIKTKLSQMLESEDIYHNLGPPVDDLVPFQSLKGTPNSGNLCQLTKDSTKLCLNLKTGQIGSCPKPIQIICRESDIVQGFQRLHNLDPNGPVNVPYQPTEEPRPGPLQPRIFGVGSSSSPWFQIGINLRRNCRCLTPQEIYIRTRAIVDRPCTQPIPWCYVDDRATCLDMEFDYDPVALYWSQEACQRQSILEHSSVDFQYYN